MAKSMRPGRYQSAPSGPCLSAAQQSRAHQFGLAVGTGGGPAKLVEYCLASNGEGVTRVGGPRWERAKGREVGGGSWTLRELVVEILGRMIRLSAPRTRAGSACCCPIPKLVGVHGPYSELAERGSGQRGPLSVRLRPMVLGFEGVTPGPERENCSRTAARSRAQFVLPPALSTIRATLIALGGPGPGGRNRPLASWTRGPTSRPDVFRSAID